MSQIRLIDLIKRYKGLSHQIAAIHMLEKSIPQELLDRQADWVDCFMIDEGVNQPPDG